MNPLSTVVSPLLSVRIAVRLSVLPSRLPFIPTLLNPKMFLLALPILEEEEMVDLFSLLDPSALFLLPWAVLVASSASLSAWRWVNLAVP